MLDNINPNMWGKSFWSAIHYITIAYPNNPTDEDKQNIIAFFTSLQNVLPCEKCRNHFKANLISYPLTNDILSSKANLISWAVGVHNEVNRRTGKPEMSVNDAIALYTNQSSNFINAQYVVMILSILLIVGLIIYFKRNVLLNK